MRISTRHRHFAFLAFALLLATLLAALGGTSFQQNVEGFRPTGFAAEARQGAWGVTLVTRPGIGLHQGDLIIAVDGLPAADLDHLRQLVLRRESVPMQVMRGFEMPTLTYTRPRLEIDFPYLILAATGLVYLLIGLYTAFKDRQRPARLFYFWCLASMALNVLSPPELITSFTHQLVFLVDYLARILLPALTLHLFLVFPSPLLERRWLWKVIPVLYLPSALLLTFQIDQIYGGQRLFGPLSASRLQRVDHLELYFLVFAMFLAALMLALRFGQRQEWEQRRQVQWILFGIVGGYTPFLVFYVIPSSFKLAVPDWTTIAGVLPLALVPLAFAWAILRYKLLEIGLILRDSIAYSLTVLVGLFGFSLINLAIKNGLGEDVSLARNLLTFAAGVAIAGVLAPTRSAISSGLERLQLHGSFGSRRALGELGQELLHERDLQPLCGVLIDRLADGLMARANLYLARDAVMELVEPAPDLPAKLSFEAFGEELWSRDVESISAVHLPSEQAEGQQRLFAAGYRYAFPLTVRGHRIGVAVVSYKYDDEPLNSDDLDLARGLLNQASLAIENAQLLEEVHSQLRKVTRLEEHNKGILDSSPAGIVVLDAQQRVVSTNPAFSALAGVSQAAAAGKRFDELIPVAPLPSTDDGMVEISFCELSGEERYLQLSMASHRENDEALRILVVQDVSERVAMEHELKEKERLAALGMLAAGVAHEVNTPLTGISSYAQMLMTDLEESDPRYEILKKMERQTFRAAQIVNNLLEFARNRRAELVSVSLDAVLSECVNLLAERAAKAGVEIGWQPPAEPLMVLGHEGELHQVFTNLVVNALEAMSVPSPGGDRITLTVEHDEHRVRVQVSDTGPGIPAGRLERVFQPFFSSKMSRGGSGLGLAITDNIVRRHGGEIRAENRSDGRGCIFTVELPFQGG